MIGAEITEQTCVRDRGAGERGPGGHGAEGNCAAERASRQRPNHENLITRWLARSHHASYSRMRVGTGASSAACSALAWRYPAYAPRR